MVFVVVVRSGGASGSPPRRRSGLSRLQVVVGVGLLIVQVVVWVILAPLLPVPVVVPSWSGVAVVCATPVVFCSVRVVRPSRVLAVEAVLVHALGGVPQVPLVRVDERVLAREEAFPRRSCGCVSSFALLVVGFHGCWCWDIY